MKCVINIGTNQGNYTNQVFDMPFDKINFDDIRERINSILDEGGAPMPYDYTVTGWALVDTSTLEIVNMLRWVSLNSTVAEFAIFQYWLYKYSESGECVPGMKGNIEKILTTSRL